MEKVAKLLSSQISHSKTPTSPPKYISLHDFQEKLHDYESRLLPTHENAFLKKDSVFDIMKKAWRIFDLHRPHYQYSKYFHDSKSDTKADRHRKEGNAAFLAGEY